MQEKNVKCALGRKEDGFMREGHNDSEVESNFMQRTGMGRDWGNSIQVRKNSVCKYKGTKVERWEKALFCWLEVQEPREPGEGEGVIGDKMQK